MIVRIYLLGNEVFYVFSAINYHVMAFHFQVSQLNQNRSDLDPNDVLGFLNTYIYFASQLDSYEINFTKNLPNFPTNSTFLSNTILVLGCVDWLEFALKS